ncbi:MAG TPA: circularly permuted type 2 ATP-grasp protein, partial [Acidimicrobiales bacterium]|nr:circularly permuted type 2 ATP-grasp protein [Acidimicrobiales bacterium]
GLGLAELHRRRAEAGSLLDDQGVTYNFKDAPPGGATRWKLDPVPVVVTSEEWARTESAVVQRAELLNLVLTDLYGPRRLVGRGLLPPEVVYGHPGFLRACAQVRIPGAQQLFTLAVDVARDRDGSSWVLADRAQAPSGAGYALANRVVTSRVFPSVYRDSQVHRLAPFFRALRAGLEAVAPPSAEEPRIVVLSPGPRSETAFEHAFLSATLGYSLVEGADLTTRRDRVWVRSLGRLEAVDVILRRVDASFCDPLELRPDSRLGVPGLIEACRQGTVSVVNTLGSGLLENPGLLPFLPQLALHLLGEPLALPAVPTWWCGDPAGRSHVLANLPRLVMKPIARDAGSCVVLGWEQSAYELEELRRQIEARPHWWVGQEQLGLASTPTLTDRGLEAGRSVVRAFAVRRGDSYLAMPGGLTRVQVDDGAVISSQRGAISKDTWVLSSEPEPMTALWLSSGPPTAGVEPAASMSSRAAEHLFWLARYAERAEDAVRLLRVVHDRRADFQRGRNPAGTACLRALLVALTEVTATYPGFSGDGAASRLADPGEELQSVALDDEREGTLAFSIQQLLHNAHAVRDQLSLDTWPVISSLQRDVLDRRTLGRATLGGVLTSLLALSGLAAESMVRDPGWRFMDAGRRIERGLHVAALLRVTVTVERDAAADSLLLESILTAAESIITYRRRYRSHAQLATMLDLVLLDPDNPRSLAYQLDRLREDLEAFPRPDDGTRLAPAERTLLHTSTALRVADTVALARAGPDGTRPELDGLLAKILSGLHDIADAIAQAHFSHLLPQREMLTPADPAAARAVHALLP